MRLHPACARGVTLIELTIVIVLTGILAAMIVYFVVPVRSYIDTSRRAALADAADIALRRIGRDLRLALPNSVRTNGASLELLLVRTAGRYRTDSGATNHCTGGASDDPLAFGSADTCFMTIGNIPNLAQVTTSDYVVVFNLQPGTDKADAYQKTTGGGNCGAACNKSPISTAPLTAFAGEDRIEFASNTFTYESPGSRFFIIEGAVSYVCDTGAGTLTRRWNYTPDAGTSPTAIAGGSSALMATGVTACSFTYDTVSQGAGLVTLHLTLSTRDSRGDLESASLYHAVHVNNVP